MKKITRVLGLFIFTLTLFLSYPALSQTRDSSVRTERTETTDDNHHDWGLLGLLGLAGLLGLKKKDDNRYGTTTHRDPYDNDKQTTNKPRTV